MRYRKGCMCPVWNTPAYVNRMYWIAEGGLTIWDAVKANEIGQVEQLLARAGVGGRELVNQDSGEGTPLMLAAERNLIDMMRLLILSGSNVNAVDEAGRTALMRAAQADYVEPLHLLIQNGADPNILDFGGMTALLIASAKGFVDIVEALIELRVNLDGTNFQGQTALMWAAMNHQVDVVDRLLSAGAMVNLRDEFGATAFVRAVAGGFVDIMDRLIIYGADWNVRFEGNDTPLILAAGRGYVDVVDRLLGLGVEDINAQSESEWSEGYTALMSAIDGDYSTSAAVVLRMVKMLLEAGANVLLRNEDNLTALDMASRKRDDNPGEEAWEAVVTLLTNAEEGQRTRGT